MPVVVAVKGEGVGAQRGIEWDDLCLCIRALSVSLRIGELIFMKIDERRQLSEGGVKAAQCAQVNHGSDDEQVVVAVQNFCLLERKAQPIAAQAPTKMACRQRELSPIILGQHCFEV